MSMEVCPLCGRNNDAFKVSALYKTGYTIAKTGSGQATLQTKLSKYLAPPDEPIHPLRQPGCGLFTLMLLLLNGPILLFGNDGIGIGVTTGLILTSAVLLVVHLDWEKSGQKPEWESAMLVWDRLYYCTRDDIVFLPGEEGSAPSEGMLEFIYEEI